MIEEPKYRLVQYLEYKGIMNGESEILISIKQQNFNKSKQNVPYCKDIWVGWLNVFRAECKTNWVDSLPLRASRNQSR